MPWSIITNLIDILIVGSIIYFILQNISGTRAIQLIKGLMLIFIASVISQYLHFNTVNWLLRNVLTIILVALPIVFQPELRRALEQLGRGGFLKEQLWHSWGAKEINEIVSAVHNMAENRTGALIVLSRKVGLRNYVETGVRMKAELSKELLENVFIPLAPLHDGAVIIEDGIIEAAGCFLPLSTNPDINPKLGTRHRAALGISEESDALAIIVSEESGVISIAKDGHLSRYLEESTLREQLFSEFEVRQKSSSFNLRGRL